MNSYYDYEYDYEPYKSDKELEKEHAYDNAAGFMEEIVKQLYSKEPMNMNIFEFQLEELAHYFGIRIPVSDLTIERNNKS